jgi:hypothetical protein
MKHHHQQMLLQQQHHHRISPAAPAPPPSYVVVASSPPPMSSGGGKRHHPQHSDLNTLAILGFFLIFLFLLYLISMSVSPQFFLRPEDSPLSRGNNARGGRSLRYDGNDDRSNEEDDPGRCVHQLEQEKRIKTKLVDQVKQLEMT